MGGVEMRRRDFLIGAGALTLTAAGGPLLFRRGRAFAGSTPVEGMIPFNDCDTLENIRAIIKHNNFRFEVDHNWLYDHYGFASTQADASPRVVPQIIIPPAPVPPDPDLPPKFDLRDINGHSYISPLRDQAETGECQQFGAAAAAEASYNRHNGLYDDNCIILSPMYLRWVYSGGDNIGMGLYHGMTGSGMPWQGPTGQEGTCREEDFPFVSFDDHMGGSSSPPAIQLETAKAATRITFRRCGLIYPYNYWETTNRIKRAIYRYGAVAAGILLSSAMRAYKSGVYEDSWIYPSTLPYLNSESNHAIALVGWDDNPPEGGNGGCWILRNTWGQSWGEGGYMRIRYFSAGVNSHNAYLEAESPGDGSLKMYGSVKVDGGDLIGTTITLSGDDSFEAVCIGSDYGFSTLKPGHYRLTPYKPGILFTPLYQDVNLTAGYAVVNFSGIALDG